MEFVLKQIIEDEKMEHRVPSSKEKATWTPLVLYLDIVYLKKVGNFKVWEEKTPYQ